jgi:predicted permease
MITIGLGIGACVGIVAIVDVVLFRPLPYTEPDQLVSIMERSGAVVSATIPLDSYVKLAQEEQNFSGILAYKPVSNGLLQSGAGTEIASLIIVSPNVFDVLGVSSVDRLHFRVSIGDSAAVVSNAFWRQNCVNTGQAANCTFILDQTRFRIIGALQQDFIFPAIGAMQPTVLIPRLLAPRGDDRVMAIGRLKPGVSIERAQSVIDVVSRRLMPAPGQGQGRTIVLTPLRETLFADLYERMQLLFLAGVAVLILAGINVSLLLAVMYASRRKEFAIRSALGARPLTLIFQIGAEVITLTTIAGLVSIAGSHWVLRSLASGIAPARLGAPQFPSIDLRIATFGIVVSVVLGIAITAVLAWQLTNVPLDVLRSAIHGSGAGAISSRFSSAVIVVELAVAITLSVSCAAMLESLWHLSQVDMGFAQYGLRSLTVHLPRNIYVDRNRLTDFYQRLCEGLSVTDEHSNIAVIESLPMSGAAPERPLFRNQKRASDGGIWRISANYFKTVGIQIVSGRTFTPEDSREERAVGIASQSMARLISGSDSPIGSRFALPTGESVEIVGIAKDTRRSPRIGPVPALYRPWPASGYTKATFVARCIDDCDSLIARFRASVHRLEPLAAVQTADVAQATVGPTADIRAVAIPLTGFAILTSVLATVGVVGLVGYLITSARNEIGIRLALGGEAARVRNEILGRFGRLGLIGALLGAAGAITASRGLTALLFDVHPADTFLIGAALFPLLSCGSAAIFVATRKLHRIDPAVLFRTG